MALFSWSCSERAMVRFHILMSSFSISCTIIMPMPRPSGKAVYYAMAGGTHGGTNGAVDAGRWNGETTV